MTEPILDKVKIINEGEYRMNRDFGKKESKIWLIGDSEPKNFKEKLENPLDYKHPAIHNIFTPILNQIQDEVFKIDNRIDIDNLYIRNAIRDVEDWNNIDKISEDIKELNKLLYDYKPLIIIPFGRRAFEFTRRAVGEESRDFQLWNTYKIGQEFIERCKNFNCNNINIIPLLHVSIARRNFLEAHKYFCKAINEVTKEQEENYFIATGKLIGTLLVKNKEKIDCWKR